MSAFLRTSEDKCINLAHVVSIELFDYLPGRSPGGEPTVGDTTLSITTNVATFFHTVENHDLRSNTESLLHFLTIVFIREPQ